MNDEEADIGAVEEVAEPEPEPGGNGVICECE